MNSNPGSATLPVASTSKDSGVVPGQENSPQSHSMSLRTLRAGAEVAAIRYALQETGWNRKQAARLLSISYRGLLYKMSQHKITPESDGQLASIESKDE